MLALFGQSLLILYKTVELSFLILIPSIDVAPP